MPWEVIHYVHSVADAQRMPANIIFTDVEGNIIDDDGPDVAPHAAPVEDHRSVDPVDSADGLYMGINNPPPVHVPTAETHPPDFPVHPAVAGIDALHDDNFFLPLADDDNDGEEEDGRVGAADDIVGNEEVGTVNPHTGNDLGENAVGGPPAAVAPVETVQPPQHNYNIHPRQGRNYSHCYGDDEQVDEANFFQTARIPGVLYGANSVHVPEAFNTDLIAHHIMIIIATKVAAGETHIFLKQGLKEFGVKGKQAVYKELDVLHLQNVFTPRDPGCLTSNEKGKALDSLMFLEKK
mmetsp:Transcript_20024/g.42020  ORF Transcript_20024/g.42020 Transcript_20024/m.42020 type:complete len:294 (+) Transcript_20024:528-1409(+)